MIILVRYRASLEQLSSYVAALSKESRLFIVDNSGDNALNSISSDTVTVIKRGNRAREFSGYLEGLREGEALTAFSKPDGAIASPKGLAVFNDTIFEKITPKLFAKLSNNFVCLGSGHRQVLGEMNRRGDDVEKKFISSYMMLFNLSDLSVVIKIFEMVESFYLTDPMAAEVAGPVREIVIKNISVDRYPSAELVRGKIKATAAELEMNRLLIDSGFLLTEIMSRRGYFYCLWPLAMKRIFSRIIRELHRLPRIKR